MRIGGRCMVTGVGVALVVAAGAFPLLAQDPAAKKGQEKDATATLPKKVYDPSRRVPDYFGQIGLSNEQREAIYKVRATHQEKIDALKKQILEQEAKSMVECEAVLTDVQKKLLRNLRDGSGRSNNRGGSESAKTTK